MELDPGKKAKQMELKTIEKALMVFNCFAQGDTSVSTTELAIRLNTNKATMSRVLSTLRKYDYLEQDPRTRKYRLGSAMVEMARAVHRSLDGNVTSVVAPIANQLRDTVGETVHLEVLSGNNLYLAYVAVTPNPISLNIGVGDQVMPHAHAGSKAIVAFSPPDVIDNWLKKDFSSYTKNTITEPALLRKEYRKIRETGIAYDFGGYYEEINAIGAPIFNHENTPVAGLLIVVPSYRMQDKWEQRYIDELKKAANLISSQLRSSYRI